jgi:hypothetical protein
MPETAALRARTPRALNAGFKARVYPRGKETGPGRSILLGLFYCTAPLKGLTGRFIGESSAAPSYFYKNDT